ncbi:hypothetical protein JTB14_000039, partial [Gonioctena quinquepunctata]
WVLINYPSTLEQAVLLEEALTGVEVPSAYKATRTVEPSVDLDYSFEEPTTYDELRNSKLLKNPLEKKDQPFFDSALTAYIKFNDLENEETSTESETLSTNIDEPKEDNSPLDKFYSDMGCNYSMYCKNVDFDAVKYLAKLIIGDYSIPPKTSLELFGDTLKYISVDRMDIKKSFSDGIKSVKKGTKKEPQRKEKKIKTKEDNSDVAASAPGFEFKKPLELLSFEFSLELSLIFFGLEGPFLLLNKIGVGLIFI